MTEGHIDVSQEFEALTEALNSTEKMESLNSIEEMGNLAHEMDGLYNDFEFVDGHRSHLGDGAPSMTPTADPVHQGHGALPLVTASAPEPAQAMAPAAVGAATATATLEAPPAGAVEPRWSADGEAELHKIPFFVRSKVRRNTETFARERGIGLIDAETLYDAKAHLSH